MDTSMRVYCLDANVFIQPWRTYYSPHLCPDYWTLLSELGVRNKIFIPEVVYEEITRTEDDLSDWIKTSNIPIRKIDAAVTKCLKEIYEANPLHKLLVDNTKQRSLADPWVIAHAINEKACVVTKEEKITAISTKRIKIPNVCDNMGVNWINDFQMVNELNIKFTCTLG